MSKRIWVPANTPMVDAVFVTVRSALLVTVIEADADAPVGSSGAEAVTVLGIVVGSGVEESTVAVIVTASESPGANSFA